MKWDEFSPPFAPPGSHINIGGCSANSLCQFNRGVKHLVKHRVKNAPVV